MKKLYYSIFPIATLLLANIASADDNNTFGTILNKGTELISESLLPIMVAIGLIVFIVGVIDLMRKADSPNELEKWKNVLIFGIVALFLMVSVVGILSVLKKSVSNDGSVVLPLLPKE